MASQLRLERMRKGTAIAAKMMIPPMVGVPALDLWPWGPSSRMFCPNSRLRRNSMNLGLRNTHMRVDAVPAMSTRPVRALALTAAMIGVEINGPRPRR
jgi:hypothetical protein